MSRKIDITAPLSQEETEYVRARPWMIRDAELQGIKIQFFEEAEEAEEPEDYSGWVKKDLEAEIERRNAERDEDDQIVPDTDKNADLIAALIADDADDEETEED